MAEGAGDKKHEATQYRRDKAREEGQIARSQDLVSALMLLGLIGVLKFTGATLFNALKESMQHQFQSEAYWYTDRASVLNGIYTSTQNIAIALLPLMLFSVLIVLTTNWFQIGFLLLPDKLNLDWTRIDPLKGFQRVFSMSNGVRVLFGILKIGIIGTVILMGAYGQLNQMLSAAHLPIEQVGQALWDSSVDTSLQAGVILLVLAVTDFGYQKWKHEQDLKMSDQELRDEVKLTQGDPALVARRRAVQRQLAQQRVGAAVPKADVIVTNPTELAVALQYDPETMRAPIVIAKGADELAKKIRQIALQHSIPIVERKPLAQALFKSVDIGKPIPMEQYAAVAEVLKYVYQLKGKKMPGAA